MRIFSIALALGVLTLVGGCKHGSSSRSSYSPAVVAAAPCPPPAPACPTPCPTAVVPPPPPIR